MKKKYYFLSMTLGLFLFSGSYLSTYAQITTPRVPSPAAEVSQTVGISKVTVTYSRPSVNGRVIWGALVPYGWNIQGYGAGNEAPWRAGANENTVIEFSHDAKFGGKDIKAGTYGLFFVINEDNSATAVLSHNSTSWGSFWYDSSEDALRVDLQTREAPFHERLTYEFRDIDRTSMELDLVWEKKEFPVKIEFDVDAIVIANAKAELRNATAFTWNGPYSAANYALNANKELDQALAWANQAVAANPSFPTLSLKSNILTALNRNDEAKTTMESAMAVANQNQLNNYAYQLMGRKNFTEAIRILKLNVEKYPTSANAHDSLGEAYALSGDKKNAIKSFKKSLSLNPPAPVKANSEKYLKQLEGN